MNTPAISRRAYARHRGVTHKAVDDAIAAGRLRKSLTRDGKIRSVEEADAEWAATTRSDRVPLTGPSAKDPVPDYGESRARREAAEAEIAEIELAKLRGELVPAADVLSRMQADYSSVKTRLLGVPSRARQQDPGLTAPQVALFDDLIREALEGLAAGDE